MQFDEMVIILNPQAAKGKAKKQEEAIRKALSRSQATVTMLITEVSGGAQRLAKEAALAGTPLIVAAGGDGTINEVVNGIMEAEAEGAKKRPAIGVIPVGRGNDFAWGMGIPASIEKAADLILGSRSRVIDIARVTGGNYPEGRWFINGLGVGFEPLVNFEASRFKRISGVPSYILALLRVMIAYPAPYTLTLNLDGEQVQVQSQQLSVCNGRRMGSAFIMAPDSIFDDGYLDIVYANTPIPRRRLIPIALRFFKGTQVELPVFSVARAKRVTIESMDNPLPVHVDGEEISRGCMRVSIELLESALTFLC